MDKYPTIQGNDVQLTYSNVSWRLETGLETQLALPLQHFH